MANDVYYSRIFSNFSVYAKVHAGLDHNEFSEAVINNSPLIDAIIDRDRRHYSGQRLTQEELPPAFFARAEKKIGKLPEAFFANGYIVVQAACADVFSQFELGETELVPVKIYQNDRETEVNGRFKVFNFSCVKDSFRPEQSTDLSGNVFDPAAPKVNIPYEEKDGQIALSKDALQGPDLWFEKRFKKIIFMSGRLHDALKAQKLHVPFKFIKCRVVES